MSELALLTVDGRIARLTLNRPDKRNAMSVGLLEAMQDKLNELRANGEVTVCIVTGAEPTFCAGMDLRAVLDDPDAPKKLLGTLAEVTIALRNLPAVTIARVNNAAIGGGCGLMATCDLQVTHPDAKLGYPEIDLGVCPGVVAPWMVQLVGAGRARRILLQGGTMSGLRAYELGMVSHCVPKEELDSTVDDLAASIAKAGPQALRATKGFLNEIEGDRMEQLVRKGAEISASVIATPEAQAMLSSIFGK